VAGKGKTGGGAAELDEEVWRWWWFGGAERDVEGPFIAHEAGWLGQRGLSFPLMVAGRVTGRHASRRSSARGYQGVDFGGERGWNDKGLGGARGGEGGAALCCVLLLLSWERGRRREEGEQRL
jgi:hypothetical protein